MPAALRKTIRVFWVLVLRSPCGWNWRNQWPAGTWLLLGKIQWNSSESSVSLLRFGNLVSLLKPSSERLSIAFTSNGKRKFVPSFPFTWRLLFVISTHKLVVWRSFLSKRIALSCFCLLIFYFEKFSTWICRFPFAVYVKLNLSIIMKKWLHTGSLCYYGKGSGVGGWNVFRRFPLSRDRLSEYRTLQKQNEKKKQKGF